MQVPSPELLLTGLQRTQPLCAQVYLGMTHAFLQLCSLAKKNLMRISEVTMFFISCLTKQYPPKRVQLKMQPCVTLFYQSSKFT